MRRIFFSLLLLLGCLSAAADVVTGRFIDAQSGEVLSDVEVCILTIHESAMGFHQLRCDSLGRFACNVAGYNCRLEASCLRSTSAHRKSRPLQNGTNGFIICQRHHQYASPFSLAMRITSSTDVSLSEAMIA